MVYPLVSSKVSGGLNKVTPLSPFFFLLVAEALSHGLNGLLNSSKIFPFSLPRGCIPVSHLSFVDDVVVFMEGQRANIKALLDFLDLYQQGSG